MQCCHCLGFNYDRPPVRVFSYVHRKGWQQHFRSYCIPEDLVPRLLSPGYFQHYRSPVDVVAEVPLMEEENRTAAHSENGNAVDSDRMVLGLGPFSKYMWRLPRLAPIVGTPRRFRWLKGAQEQEKVFGGQESSSDSNTEVTPVDIEEEPDGGALTVVTSESETKVELPVGTEKAIVVSSTKDGKGGNPASWLTTRVPPLPSYVPFGEVSNQFAIIFLGEGVTRNSCFDVRGSRVKCLFFNIKRNWTDTIHIVYDGHQKLLLLLSHVILLFECGEYGSSSFSF